MKKKFGDRRDGYKDLSAHGTSNILIDLKPNRCDSTVYMNTNVDVTDFVRFMNDLKKTNDQLTYYHGFVTIMSKTLYSKPLMNRFVQNRTMFMHNDVSLAFVAKTQFNEKSEEILTLLKIDREDNLLTISKKTKEKVNKIRSNNVDSGANNLVEKIGKSPKFIRVPITGLLKWFDKHGWLPSSIMDDNIYYSSAILSNLGTFDCGGIYHNLTNFGTSSSLITFGAIKEINGRKMMEMGITIDERIADGFYFCKCLKLIEYMFNNPKLMLDNAGNKVSIPDNIKKKDNLL